MNIPLPVMIAWDRWAAQVTEALDIYGVGKPGSEETWTDWASQICNNPALQAFSLPNPGELATWQQWGTALLSALGDST